MIVAKTACISLTVTKKAAEHYQTLMTAVYEKDAIELLYLLGQGIDLTWNGPDGGDTSSLLTLAIFRDSDTYKFQASKDLQFPRPGVSLTYLLLQSLAGECWG